MQALGMIETRGILAAVEAADAMLKAADVALVERTKVGGGLVTVTVTGDVAAVTAAVDAGAAAVERLGADCLQTRHVIPRPGEELEGLFEGRGGDGPDGGKGPGGGSEVGGEDGPGGGDRPGGGNRPDGEEWLDSENRPGGGNGPDGRNELGDEHELDCGETLNSGDTPEDSAASNFIDRAAETEIQPARTDLEAPGAQEVTDAPEVLEDSEALEDPEVMEAPEVLGAREVLEAPEVPETPEVLEVPDAPEVPEAPEVPDVPEVPEAPEVPNAPDAPDASDIPTTPPSSPDPTPTTRAALDYLAQSGGIGQVMKTLVAMKVTELRSLAREYPELPIAGREISKANKTQLLRELEALYETQSVD